MKIGLAGYQGSGKSSLFQWLTGVEPDPAKSHVGQSAMAAVPDVRLDELAKIFKPKKLTHALIEVTDTPGLSRDQEGNAQKLASIREADSLVLVVAGYGGADPKDLPHLFDRFYRADPSRNSQTGGHGIGLSVAKAIVTAHNGKIQAATDDGHSLQITATFPT